MRASLVIHGDDRRAAGGVERKPSVTRPMAPSAEVRGLRFDADGANLAAQCDGLDSEGQLNGWWLTPPLARPLGGRPAEYTAQTIVETIPYARPLCRSTIRFRFAPRVQQFEVTQDEAGQRLDNYVRKRLGGVPRSRVYRVIRKGEVRVNGKRASPENRLALERQGAPAAGTGAAGDPRAPLADLTAPSPGPSCTRMSGSS